jgi:hypothetical protein
MVIATTLTIGGWVRAQPPGSALDGTNAEAKTGPAQSAGWEFDEEMTRTREELENLELWLTAKRAQLRAAEMSSEVESDLQADYERMAKKGVTSALRHKVARLEFVEAESHRATIQAEIGDLQLRYNRTKRYLGRLQQYGTAAMKSSEERALELTEVLTRLKYAERAISKLQEELKDAKSHVRDIAN